LRSVSITSGEGGGADGLLGFLAGVLGLTNGARAHPAQANGNGSS
jgi:hypothetical protein